MGEFRDYLNEQLKIVKKKWNLKDTLNLGYEISINDSEEHSIVDRMQNRTDVKLNDMNNKLQKGLDLILYKVKNNFFKRDINYVELTYKKSNFKAIFMIKPKNKFIRLSSIFEISYSTDNALLWNINEFLELNPEYKYLVKSKAKYDFFTIDQNKFDRYFSVELNENKKSFDVYVSDTNDIEKLIIDF